jgi:peroxiredoxin (alkyl hydroperoxide reductase subunit C)
MTVTVGSEVPDLIVSAYRRDAGEPEPYTLRQHRGRWVVLFFYPRDFTFVCPTELHDFARLQGEFATHDTIVVAASTDSYWSHRAWFETEPMLATVTYPVIADTAHALTRVFGVLLEDGAAQRATFVIDPRGVVRAVTISDLNVGRSAQETLRVVQALQTGALCPAAWRPGQPTLLAA